MITYNELIEKTKQWSILEEERKSRMELANLKKEILNKIVENVQTRENNFGKVSVGDIIVSKNSEYEVIKVESSYVNVISEGTLSRIWLADIDSTIGHNKNNLVESSESQVKYKGYKTVNISPELKECILGNKYNPYLMLSFLMKYDQMMERHEPKIQKRIVEQVMKYAMKLGIPFDSNIHAHDDWMILEAAQGNIRYNTPSVKKIKSILETLDINKYKDNSIISNLQEMIRS